MFCFLVTSAKCAPWFLGCADTYVMCKTAFWGHKHTNKTLTIFARAERESSIVFARSICWSDSARDSALKLMNCAARGGENILEKQLICSIQQRPRTAGMQIIETKPINVIEFRPSTSQSSRFRRTPTPLEHTLDRFGSWNSRHTFRNIVVRSVPVDYIT